MVISISAVDCLEKLKGCLFVEWSVEFCTLAVREKELDTLILVRVIPRAMEPPSTSSLLYTLLHSKLRVIHSYESGHSITG